jgi:hypothetical protein
MNNKEKIDESDNSDNLNFPLEKSVDTEVAKSLNDSGASRFMTKTKEDSQEKSLEVEKKIQQFFGHSTVFDDEESVVNSEKFDDNDIVNVPAFFRRKR